MIFKGWHGKRLNGSLDFLTGTETIVNEPMLYGADYNYAVKHGGILTKDFLKSVYDKYGFLNVEENFIFDSRVSMLMPGWYPSIPGWHLDEVERDNITGQPIPTKENEHKIHVLCCLGDAESETEFLKSEVKIDIEDIPEDVNVYEYCSKVIDNTAHKVERAENGCLYEFNSLHFHRATPAKKRGWRWFARATMGTNRKPVNQIRQQTQVYIIDPNRGW